MRDTTCVEDKETLPFGSKFPVMPDSWSSNPGTKLKDNKV